MTVAYALEVKGFVCIVLSSVVGDTTFVLLLMSNRLVLLSAEELVSVKNCAFGVTCCV